ncbi:hypothetical protein ACFLWA_00970 [Chloroflexota bacterium]
MKNRSRLTTHYRHTLPLIAAGLLAILGLWIVLAPAESRLGGVVKLVFLHGALVRVGLALFTVAGLIGLVALLFRRPVWYRGTLAAGTAALVVWILYVISSMVVTGLAWGQVVAWNEPRVRATASILLAAIVVAIASRLVDHPVFTALASLAMGIVPWVIVAQADAIRHPIDPIGGSESTSIQLFYWLIVATMAGLAAVLVAWLWMRLELRARERESE